MNTAPKVPPKTITKAVNWMMEPTLPPSRTCPPMIAVNPSAKPIRVALSMGPIQLELMG